MNAHDSPRVAPREWLAAGVIALVLTLFLQLPYAMGYAAARPGTVFSGLLINLSDVTYLSAIQQGMAGGWLYQIRFTSEPHSPALLYTFYLTLGHAARVLRLDEAATWHLARAVTGFVMLLVAFGFISYFVQRPAWRRIAFLLFALGAGFDFTRLPGEILAPTSAVPLDLHMPEAHVLYSALTYPHYSAAIALMLILFWCALRGWTESPTTRARLLIGVGGALAGVGTVLVYPFLVILTGGALGAYYLWLTWRARTVLWGEGVWLVALFLPALPILLYYQWVLASNEIIRLWNQQVDTWSPNPLHYLLTYAPYMALAVWNAGGVGFGGKPSDPRRVFLWVWLGVVALLLYAPLSAQRRFVEGVQAPLAILAALGLYEAALPRLARTAWFRALLGRPNYTPAGMTRLIAVLVVALCSIGSLRVYASAVYSSAIAQPYPLFRARSELEAMDWLRVRAQADEVVLASYYTGSFVPLRAGARAYIGQYYETAHFLDKLDEVDRFFSTRTGDAERLRFLEKNRIAYLLYGDAERGLGGFDPAGVSYLTPLFVNENTTIYAVDVRKQDFSLRPE